MHTHNTTELLRRTTVAFGLMLGSAAGAQAPARAGEQAGWMSQYQARARLAANELAQARLKCDALDGTQRTLCQKQARGPDIAARADAMADAIEKINAADTTAREGTRPASNPPSTKR